jgi:hypothetical protein
MFGLSFAVGCTNGSSGDQGVGGTAGDGGAGGTGGSGDSGTPIGLVLSGIDSLADEIIGKNRSLIDGLRFTVSHVGPALADAMQTSVPAATHKDGDDPPCALGSVDGMQFAYNEATNAYEPTGDRAEPNGSVRFSVYETVGDAPDIETLIGSLLLSCAGDSEEAHVTAMLQVDGVDIIRAEGDASPDPSAELGSFDVTRIQGFLASADGTQHVDFGASGEDSISRGGDGRSGSLAFNVELTITASLQYDEESGGETHYDLSLIGSVDSAEFRFEAMLAGTDGRLSGPGVFDREQHVCCFDGRFEDMTVTEGSPSCDPLGDYTATPLSEDELAAIQAGSDALTGMYIAVESAAVAMGALADASAKHVLHTPPDCDNLPDPEGDDCLSVPIELWNNPTYDPTFSAIYDELFCSRGCAGGFCHHDGDGELLFRSKQEAYCALVDVAPSALCENDFSARVVPGDPDASLLVAKFGFEPACGSPMPIGSRESNDLVTPEHRAQVMAWIAAGAEYNPIRR